MKTAFAIGAHPDDIEIFMSGTLILLKEAGYEIHYMNIANGCCGTIDYGVATITKMRRDESIAAAELIGAVFHETLCDDLSIFYDKPTLARVASVMRVVAPEIVLTHSPSDYMEDHQNTCRLAVTAAFVRGMPNFHVEPPREFTQQKVTVYHAQPFLHVDPLRRPVAPDLYVDVSGVLEQKVAMLAEHKSQKKWLDESQGHDSYLQTMQDLDRQCGEMSGKFEYAEGWRRHLHLGLCGPEDDPLTGALANHVSRAN